VAHAIPIDVDRDLLARWSELYFVLHWKYPGAPPAISQLIPLSGQGRRPWHSE
jgi:hypothetical protein